MTPWQWCELATQTKTPAGRFELVREAIENKWITPRLARKLLDFGAPTHLKLVASDGAILEQP